tara:strand:+ start:3584 stop:4219 length:636 start_codon:yes stop_codon:yes gene_type:complete
MASLLRLYTNEPDQTFEGNAQVALWLELAYNDFRSFVAEIDPTIYAVRAQIPTVGSDTLSLSAITGATVAGPRLDTLLWVTLTQGTTELQLRGGAALQDILHGAADYVLLNAEIRFARELASGGTISLYYLPAQDIDWPTEILAATFVDDLTRFHDMIPLIAYLQYAIVDGADHPQQLLLLQRRQEQLRHYLAYRGGSSTEEIVDSRWLEP